MPKECAVAQVSKSTYDAPGEALDWKDANGEEFFGNEYSRKLGSRFAKRRRQHKESPIRLQSTPLGQERDQKESREK